MFLKNYYILHPCSFFSKLATQTIQLKEEYIQVLRQISRSLKGNEKALLAKDCEWGQEDKIKEIIDKDSNMLLAGLIYKEIEKRQAQIPYGK